MTSQVGVDRPASVGSPISPFETRRRSAAAALAAQGAAETVVGRDPEAMALLEHGARADAEVRGDRLVGLPAHAPHDLLRVAQLRGPRRADPVALLQVADAVGAQAGPPSGS